MADNFSDKVVKKLQKQNLAVDLTEEVVKAETPEEVAPQSQDVQAMGANDVTAFTPGSAGLTMTDAVYKDIIISPGPGGGSQNQNTASQINFYSHFSAVTTSTTGYDQQYRATIFNYIEGDAAPALVIGGYNGSVNLAPTTSWGGAVSGLTAAKIWIHPFTGKIDASTFDGNKLVLTQANNTPQISFGTATTTQSSLATAGDLAWDGTTFKVYDGSSVKTLAYTSQVPGAQNIYSTFTDGTTPASPATTSDTFKFRGSNGVTVATANNDGTHGDNLLISLSSVPNGALANSAVTIGNTSVSLGNSATSLAGLTAVTATTFNGSLNGNANTATSAATLTTARTIQGVSFNGSADITVVTNGTGVTVSGTQVSIGQVVGTSSAVTFASVTANSVRIGNAAGTVDTSSGNLILDSTGGQVTINDNVVITGSSVTLAAASTSTISANSNKITNVATPTAGTDAANKSYVDGLIQGLDVHDSVRAIAATAINTSVLYFQQNAASATAGAAIGTCYIESSANQALSSTYFDGVTLNSGTISTGDRVLVTAGATTATYNIGGVTTTPTGGVNVMNGVYVVTNAGSGSTKWRLDRALDSDDNIELEGGTFVFVQEGTTYADTGWLITNNTLVTKLSIGSGAITFTQFSSAGQITATAPLVKTGNALSLSLKANGGLVVDTNTLAVDLGASSITGTLAVGDGGTGLTSFTDKGVFYANGTGTVGQVNGTSGQLLVANASNTPTFVTLSGDATLAAAGSLTLASTAVTAGSYGSSTSVATFTVDSKGRLTAAGSAAIPTATSSVLGLASFGSAFTVTSGAVSLNTVTVGNGGTGQTSLTLNGVLYGNGTNGISNTGQGTSGQLLVVNGTNVPTLVSMSGDATIVAGGALTLANSGVSAATYGSATQVAQVAVDVKGRITTASNVNINISSAAGSQSANTFFAAPNGSASTPTFRAIVLADLPTITVGKGGTGLTSQASAGITYYDGTNITSGSALTWKPAADTGTGANSALYVNAASLSSGTAITVNAVTGATGKLISGSLAGTEKFSIDVNGNLRATTKSFDIPHPTKEGKRLVYGVLEGPEHGVYHRGTVEGKDKIKVELPEYWYKLVGENYSVQLTSWGPYAVHLVEKTENYFIIQLSSNFIMRKLKTIKVDYVVHGARLDAPLEIEQ